LIEVLYETNLTPRDDAEIAALLENCFPTEYDGRSFFQQRPQLRVVWRAPEIVAHVAVFFRAIRLDDTLADIVGIGDVATLENHREQGLATVLLNHALAQAPAAPFAILIGRRSLYDRAGFRRAANPMVHVDLTAAWQRDAAADQGQIFGFVGIKPTRITYFSGASHPKPGAVEQWLEKVARQGARGI
jgi:predicted N-acetyltransferase YhbS